ncbi:MarR family winged helix-turn-helix transcriptional regulator [Acidipropionibacterium virtanenii]|uniref:Putative HTH-type transcriptional regulator n=1 Tax=Acidipropionibacterium virtanenii TaxID=2057246 RepID=A0A344USU5_9ACTN|nr:MarR family transcriptional regulator [Acidipropionibacterium virtanenii]AXE38343.1 putative HTH-type transcriptional regulator [Acidipropionibacterium virtanenii]
MTQVNDDLGALVGYQLKEVQSALRSRMDETLRPLGLTTPQYVCLELLSRTPGASNAELARGAFVTRQTMNTLLRGLQERGLIERATRAPSGRALPTMLTPEGQGLLGQAVERTHQIEARLVSRLTDDQRRDLHTALAACIDGLRD